MDKNNPEQLNNLRQHAEPEWVPYSFYHDRLAPFQAHGNTPVYVIGLFNDGRYSRLIPHVAENGDIAIGTPGVSGCLFSGNIKGLDMSSEYHSVVEFVDPFTIVATATVFLSMAGQQYLEWSGRRSYIFLETRVALSAHSNTRGFEDLDDDFYFQPSIDRGEFFLHRDQLPLLLRTKPYLPYGAPFLLNAGHIEFLKGDLFSDDLVDINCYAAHGIIAQSHRHIFVGIAKRTDILVALENIAAQKLARSGEARRKAALKHKKREIERAAFVSGLRFDSRVAKEAFNNANTNGRLNPFWPEYENYLIRMEEVRFLRGVVTTVIKNPSTGLDEAAQMTQNQLHRHAMSKLVTYLAQVTKKDLGTTGL